MQVLVGRRPVDIPCLAAHRAGIDGVQLHLVHLRHSEVVVIGSHASVVGKASIDDIAAVIANLHVGGEEETE